MVIKSPTRSHWCLDSWSFLSLYLSAFSGLGIFKMRATLDVSLRYAVVVAFRDYGVVVPFLSCSFLDELAISSDSTSGLHEHFINHLFNIPMHPWNGLSCVMVNFILLFTITYILLHNTITYIFSIIRVTWSLCLAFFVGKQEHHTNLSSSF